MELFPPDLWVCNLTYVRAGGPGVKRSLENAGINPALLFELIPLLRIWRNKSRSSIEFWVVCPVGSGRVHFSPVRSLAVITSGQTRLVLTRFCSTVWFWPGRTSCLPVRFWWADPWSRSALRESLELGGADMRSGSVDWPTRTNQNLKHLQVLQPESRTWCCSADWTQSEPELHSSQILLLRTSDPVQVQKTLDCFTVNILEPAAVLVPGSVLWFRLVLWFW